MAVAIITRAVPALLLASLAPVDAICAAQWSVTPGARIHLVTETNPRLLPADHPGAADAQALAASFDVASERAAELLTTRFDAHVSQHRYRQDSALDRIDMNLAASLQGHGERSDWTARASAARDTTLTSELGGSGISSERYRHESLTGTFRTGWSATERVALHSEGGVQFDVYPGNGDGLVDYRYRHLQFGGSGALDERSQLVLSARGGELDSTGGEGARDASVELRYERRIHERASFAAFAGPSWVDRRGRRSSRGERLGATFAHASERLSTALSLQRSIAPTGRGILSERDQASLTLSLRLTPRLEGSLASTYIRSKDVLSGRAAALSDVRYRHVAAGLNWRLLQRWSTSLQLGYSDQSLRGQSRPFHGLTAGLGITWDGDSHVW